MDQIILTAQRARLYAAILRLPLCSVYGGPPKDVSIGEAALLPDNALRLPFVRAFPDQGTREALTACGLAAFRARVGADAPPPDADTLASWTLAAADLLLGILDASDGMPWAAAVLAESRRHPVLSYLPACGY